MKNHAKSFRELLESDSTQKRINNIKKKTSDDIAWNFDISNDDVNNLRDLINKNKWIKKGMPKWEIEFKGHIIPIDLIFDRVSRLEDLYSEALEISDKSERDSKLELANNKLISTIFTLLDEEEKKSRNEAEAKAKKAWETEKRKLSTPWNINY